jgi:hypothetical protein
MLGLLRELSARDDVPFPAILLGLHQEQTDQLFVSG